jgi:hypothetical protein
VPPSLVIRKHSSNTRALRCMLKKQFSFGAVPTGLGILNHVPAVTARIDARTTGQVEGRRKTDVSHSCRPPLRNPSAANLSSRSCPNPSLGLSSLSHCAQGRQWHRIFWKPAPKVFRRREPRRDLGRHDGAYVLPTTGEDQASTRIGWFAPCTSNRPCSLHI